MTISDQDIVCLCLYSSYACPRSRPSYITGVIMDIRHVFLRLCNATMWLILSQIVGCLSYCEQKYYISEFCSLSVNGMRNFLTRCLRYAHKICEYFCEISQYLKNYFSYYTQGTSILKHGWAGCNENCSYTSFSLNDLKHCKIPV